MNQNTTYERLSLGSSAPSRWRVTFNHPPINLIDSVMIRELGELFTDVESNNQHAVIVFDSADPDYFLAHYDISDDNRSRIKSLPAGPTGFHPWVDVPVRLSKLPAVTISAIRGRAHGAGSGRATARGHHSEGAGRGRSRDCGSNGVSGLTRRP